MLSNTTQTMCESSTSMKSATTEQLPSAYISTKVKGVKCVREINKTKAYGDIYKTGVRLRWFMDKGVKKLASVK